MRIVFVLEHLGLGGVEKVYASLAEQINNTSNSSVYILSEKSGKIHQDVNTFFCFEKSFYKFYEQVSLIKPDIILYTKGNLLKYDFYLKIRGYNKHKTIVALHNPIFSKNYSFFDNIKRIIGSIILYRYADYVKVPSYSLKNEVLRYTKVKEDKIFVLYNPIIRTSDLDLNPLSQSNKEFCNSEFKSKYLLGVGRLEYQKNFEEMIEIYSLFIENYPEFRDYKLIILGEGSERSKLENLVCKKGLSNRVLFKGAVKNPINFMKNAECLLLTSRYEGFGMVLVEAAYVGCPFVAYDCKFGPREIQELLKFGRVIEYGDRSAFIDNLRQIIINRDSFQRPDASVLNMFTLENVSHKFISFLQDILNNKK